MRRMILALMLVTATASSTNLRAEEIPATKEPEPSVIDYCANFADKANDARIAWQAENLKKLQGELDAKIAALEAKQAEIRQWIDSRDAMLKAAGKELVDIYAKMDPEAAALQLTQLDTGTATSVIRQLSPRGASAILNVMEAKQAAKLAMAIANATLKNRKDEGW